MVKVPISSVSLQPTQTPQLSAGRVAPPADYTGRQLEEAGQALQSAGIHTQRIFTGLQDLHDAGMTQKAVNQLGDAETDIIGGFYNTVGEAAAGDEPANQTLQTFERRYREIAAGLQNPTQRAMFQEAYDRKMVGIYRGVRAHAQKATIEFNAGQAKAGAIQSAQAAIDAYRMHGDRSGAEGLEEGVQGPATQGSAYRLYLNTALRQEAAWADMVGKTPAEKDLLVQARAAQIHEGIVGGLVDEGRAKEARSYFDAIEDGAVPSASRDKMRRLVQQGATKEAGASLAFSIEDEVSAGYMREYNDPKRTMWMPDHVDGPTLKRRGQAMLDEKLRAGSISVDVYDEALSRLRQRATYIEEQRAAEITEVRKQYEAYLSENPNAGVRALPPSLYDKVLELGLIGDANNFADNGRYSTDQDVYNGLLKNTPETWRRLEEEGNTWPVLRAKLVGHLDPAALRHIEAVRAKALEVSTPEDDDIFKTHDRIQMAALENGIISSIGTGDSDDEQLAYKLFLKDVQATKTWLVSGGEKDNADTLQKAIDMALTERAQKGYLQAVREAVSGGTSLDTATSLFEEDLVYVGEGEFDVEPPRHPVDALAPGARGITSYQRQAPTHNLQSLTPEEKARAFVVIDNKKVRVADISIIPAGTLEEIKRINREMQRPNTAHNILELWVRDYGGSK